MCAASPLPALHTRLTCSQLEQKPLHCEELQSALGISSQW